MRIGIIGAGNIGSTLARHLAKLGHQVSIANSRGPESLAAFAAANGLTAVSALDAARAGDIVIITIPQKAVAALSRELFAGVADSVIVVDTGNYYPEFRDGRIEAIERGLPESTWVAQQIGRPVIKVFNTIASRSLDMKGVPPGTAGRVALPVAGDLPAAKAAVLRLVDELGFDPIDAGGLDDSWRQQPGTPAYGKDYGAADLRRALAEADRSRIAAYRVEAEAGVRKNRATREAQQQEQSVDNRNAQRLYHGTRADLKPGDLIAPGYASNYGTRKLANFIYLSATLDAATWGAELAQGDGPGRIYIVEPTGPLQDDPNLTDKKFPGNPTKSYRTREPLRVVGEVTDWQGHPPEALKAMKDRVEQLRQQGVEAIDD